ncbi:MAG: hypothetical protein CMI02_06950 [Oceanospirillaceae bacterium]|nr:hypothetical protein [Oceanospirillaceae bacterium]MBT11754.1 hypothetical protein [Oceanospirillaceae bacterium]|tara:strand:+ start:76713 stop:78392 length:1680 start_codon:yes stop_codon:yes gene_type:complete
MLAIIPLAVMAGCSPVTTEQPPVDHLPERLGYPEAGPEHAALQTPVSWWQSFDDQQLDELVSAGLTQNYSLKSAWANLARSRALWREAGAGQYPDLSLSLEKGREWRESETASAGSEASTTSDSWTAGLSSEYELDFWGRVAALDDQARMEALSSEAAVRTQANTVAGEITLNWYGYLMQQANLRLLDSQKERIDAALKVTRGRFQRGQADISDVWQQEQLLESLNSDVIAAQAALDGYQQQLALWTGQGDWLALNTDPVVNPAAAALPAVTKAVPSLPLSIIAERPDVEQAWYSVQAATAGLAAAEANRYPRFTLSASYRGSDEDLGQVLDNWVANLVAGLAMPLIDGGNRRAVVARNQAALDAAMADYQQAILQAAQDVQQALISERENAATLISLQRQLALAKKTESFQHNRYRKGVGDFLSLLTAQQDVLSLEQRVLTAHWNQIQSRITLFRAVSHGGFVQPDNNPDNHPDDSAEVAAAEAEQATTAPEPAPEPGTSAPASGHTETQDSSPQPATKQSAEQAEPGPDTAPSVAPRRFNQLNSTSLSTTHKKEASA